MSKPYVTPKGMTAQEAYDSINRWWFKNKLPRVKVRWPRYMLKVRPQLIGQTVGDKTEPKEIHLNPKFKDSSSVWLRTLIHEAVHVEQWDIPLRHCHGPRFEKRMRHLAEAGAFYGLW